MEFCPYQRSLYTAAFQPCRSALPYRMGSAVPQWLNHYATSCKVAGSRPDEVNFPIYLILLTALDPGVYSASNRNE
jgi:hypothetical protein